MTAPMIFDGAMHGAAFPAYVERALTPAYVEQVSIPTLSPGDIVITDELPAHTSAAVRYAGEATARRTATRTPSMVTGGLMRMTRRRPRQRQPGGYLLGHHFATVYGATTVLKRAQQPRPDMINTIVAA